jgi:hypothetical protein
MTRECRAAFGTWPNSQWHNRNSLTAKTVMQRTV